MALKRCAYSRLATSLSGEPRRAERELAGLFAHCGCDRVGTHHGAAMHLPEALRVQLGHQFAQRSADQVLALCRDDAHVLVCGLEVDHLVDRHQMDSGADAGLDHAQPLCAARLPTGTGRREHVAQLRKRLVDLLRRTGTRGEHSLQPGAGPRQTIGLNGLDHIVERRALESLQRVLVVGGNENDQREGNALGPVFGERLGGFEAAHARHANVQKEHLRPQRQGLLDGRCAVGDARDDAKPGHSRARSACSSVRSKASSSAIRAVAFIGIPSCWVRGNSPRHGQSRAFNGSRSVATVPPSASIDASSLSEASAPCSAARRARTCESPNCVPAVVASPGPGPVSRTRNTSCAPSRAALTMMRPPVTLGSSPCLMLFSTSGCSSSGGTAASASCGGRSKS